MLRVMTAFAYADPGTLRGQLQRGRGIAVSRAVTTPGVVDLVYESVVIDSRWDRQAEQRSSYLARLIYRLELSLEPLSRPLFDEDDVEDIGLALDVLSSLAFVGRADGALLLRQYAVAGRHWAAAVEAIGDAGAWKIAGMWDGFEEEITAAHSDAELSAAISGACEPWLSFARTQSHIRKIVDDHAARQREAKQRLWLPSSGPEPHYPGDLVDRVHVAGPGARRTILEEIGRQGDLRLLDLAEDESLRNGAGWTPGIATALRHLGAAAIVRARTWIDSADPTLETLGFGVLADFGSRDDAPHLLRALTAAADADEWCAAEDPARGLGRIGFAGAADALRHIWEITVHSQSRQAILDGIAGCAPGAVAAYAQEGLDDCEPQVQRAAITWAPDTPALRHRLTELCDDPLAVELQEAATRRLATQASG